MNQLKMLTALILLTLIQLSVIASTPMHFDILIKGGDIYDGTGNAPRREDLAISGEYIVKIGGLSSATADVVIDASGKVVSPGFINMLSWATNSLVRDGRGLSDVVQGVTLEVFGEGSSMGPFSPEVKKGYQEYINKHPNPFVVSWTTLGEYLEYLEQKGVSPNVASFVGHTTVRMNALGEMNRAPTSSELEQMKADVRLSMEEGALGLGSSLIYAPAFYAKTDEIIQLAKVVAEYNGMYISHMRSEGNQLEQSLEELITIAKQAGIPAEVYHLKAAGKENWSKMNKVIERIQQARDSGLDITADMYTYPAGATGLDAAMPPWVQEGGYDAWAKRLKDSAMRKKVIAEMMIPTDDWENLFLAAGADGVLFAYFKNPELKKYTGMRLTEVAKDRGTSIADTIIDLVIEDGTRVSTIYFLMSEENMRLQLKQPWLSFGSDASTADPIEAIQHGALHPRAYGNFARVLAKYVRDEKLISLEQAIHKLSGLPATNLKLNKRGFIKLGYYADVLVFDPAKVQDHSSFENPHKLSTGMSHVLVNGGHVIKDGIHTGATPGKVVRGPGYNRTKPQ